MDEIEQYRERIERHYGDRRQLKNGRRHRDYKPPKFWTWEFIVAIVGFLLFGLCLALGGK